MKRYLLIIVSLFFISSVFGQSAQGRYASRMAADGTIFFIEPHKLTDLSNIKRFEYDMTLLSWTDSVTINFTFESDIMTMPETLQIKSCGKTFVCKDYSSLFIDIKKKHYEIRISSKFSISEMEQILQCESSPMFSFSQNGILETASYKNKSWLKDRKKLLDIFKVYQYSKN